MQQQNHDKIEIQDVCYDALTYLDMILAKDSQLNVHQYFKEKNNPFIYPSRTNRYEFDLFLKEEAKKYGNFRLSWNFNPWYRGFEFKQNPDKSNPDIIAYLSTKFQNEITSMYFGKNASSCIIGKNNQLELFSEENELYCYFNIQNLHSINKKKIISIETQFHSLLDYDLFSHEKTKSKKYSFINIIQLLDTIQSTLKRIEFANNSKNKNKLKPKSNFGSAKGIIKMYSDFNEPLEDFKDYM